MPYTDNTNYPTIASYVLFQIRKCITKNATKREINTIIIVKFNNVPHQNRNGYSESC